MKEAQKTQEIGFDTIKYDLNTYLRYCEHATHLLDDTEETAPWATKLIKKGLPIIDERIKRIISEIRNKAKTIFNETKDTALEDFGIRTCKQAHDLSLQDPPGFIDWIR